jgi:hypothetical protein
MRRTWTAALGALLLLGTPGAASAQERGVHVDPGSPAGKEYAIPIERARREASGGEKLAPSAAAPTQAAAVPLFGQGIKPAPKHHKRKKAANGKPVKPVPVSLAPTAAIDAALAPPSTTAWTGGIPAVVLAAGVLLGFALRRRKRV